MTQTIPDGVRAELHAAYVRAVLTTPEIGRLLESRGRLRELQAVAESYASEMVAECDRLAAEYRLADESGRVGGFWAAWELCIPVPAGQRRDGHTWLPTKEIALKGFEPISAPVPGKAAASGALIQPPEPAGVKSLWSATIVERVPTQSLKLQMSRSEIFGLPRPAVERTPFREGNAAWKTSGGKD